MGVFVRAVVTGFGFSLGKALYDRVSKRLGIEEEQASNDSAEQAADAEASQDPDDSAE
jgi:hypothetical protein